MEQVKKGKNIVIALIIVVLLSDIFSIVTTYIAYTGIDRSDLAKVSLQQGCGRLILTGAILFLLYKGFGWAKWLLVVLLMTTGVMSVFLFLANFNFFVLFFGLIYAAFSVILIISKNVNFFLKSQKSNRPKLPKLNMKARNNDSKNE